MLRHNASVRWVTTHLTIDRLAPDEKALLQQLSVIGREFPLGLIRQVLIQPEADLYRLLASLQRKVVAEALALVEKNDERFYEAEVYRIKGALTLAQSGVRSPASEVTNSLESKVQSPESRVRG